MPRQLDPSSSTSSSSSSTSAMTEHSTKHILVTCRPLTSIENGILAKHFKSIQVFNLELNRGSCDISQMGFDLLIVNDPHKSEVHQFLEIIAPQAKTLSYPVILLKKCLVGANPLADALGASIIKEIRDYEGSDFFNYLLKGKLPKLQSRWWNLLKGCFRLASSASV